MNGAMGNKEVVMMLCFGIWLAFSWRDIVSFYGWVFSGHNDKWLN